jgi:DNA helicase-2/ATP-dependent DNA helicase PcrA
MLNIQEFIPEIRSAVPRLSAQPPNQRQLDCVLQDLAVPLMIAAGPGSGKTTVLVLRALRFVFVDGLLPENIVITTFTRKAAQELRARLVEWGLLLKERLATRSGTQANWRNWLDSIDINRFVTGTVDSICEEILTIHREPLDPGPVLVEGFVGDALLARRGLQNPTLKTIKILKTILQDSLWMAKSPAILKSLPPAREHWWIVLSTIRSTHNASRWALQILPDAPKLLKF